MNPQTWNNVQARNQCLCTFLVFGVHFLNVPAFYIEKAQKGLCKAKFDCVSEKQYSMSVFVKFCFKLIVTLKDLKIYFFPC